MKYQYAIEEMKQGESVALAKQRQLDAKEKEVAYHRVSLSDGIQMS